MSVNVLLFSSNVKLESFIGLNDKIGNECKLVLLTSHKLLLNEREYLHREFGDFECISFGDLLSDEENEMIDKTSYSTDINIWQYYRKIMIKKNEVIYNKLIERYGDINKGYVCCADLGIYRLFWIDKGFERLDLDYYYKKPDIGYEEFWVSSYKKRKLIFIGRLERIGYRMNLEWTHSSKDYFEYINGHYMNKEECQYLTTLHEFGKVKIPDEDIYDVKYIQDGYLPPNYTSLYLRFKPQNVSYYAWDTMSMEAFNNAGVKSTIMPFRKVLKLPYINSLPPLKKILVATSGPGDWTAQKNRSDEDEAIEAFVQIAKNNPEIEIIYRCHPTWVHPEHNGVHSIERIGEYIHYTGLNNIRISSNIPQEKLDDFVLSFSRSSLEEDMRECGLLFGEHSISMIDGGLMAIPFCSYNFTKRRNLAEGISRYGFINCTSPMDIQKTIDEYGSEDFINKYNFAVDNYNKMLDME